MASREWIGTRKCVWPVAQGWQWRAYPDGRYRPPIYGGFATSRESAAERADRALYEGGP